MRKLKLFVSLLLCLAVTHIWATPIASPSDIQEGKLYTITTSTRGAIVWDGTSVNLEGSLPLSVTLDAANPNHQFMFFKVEGASDSFYMVNVGSEMFVTKNNTKANLKGNGTQKITLKQSGNTDYPLMIDVGTYHWNLDNLGVIYINNWSTKDAGNCFDIEEVGEADEELVTKLRSRIENPGEPSVITYTTSDGKIIYPSIASFDEDIISNTYEEGVGKIIFSGTINMVGGFSNQTTLTSITIPNSVKSIGGYAFYRCSSLASITIPNSVKSIGDNAFCQCPSLNSVPLGNSVTSIGDGAFYYCSSLDSITIPNSVTSIGDSAFQYCSSLNSVTIGNSVTNIGKSAFSYTSLTSIAIPNSVTRIGESAFQYCTSLASINIPNSVTSIGENAFEYCERLDSITIPNSVTSIRRSTFSQCTSLTSITIPHSVVSIGNSAFQGCSSLTSVTIPDSVTSIGFSAFSGCSSLVSITIPNSVTSIGDYAFNDCSSLTSVTIGNSVTSIGEIAFSGCSKLSSVIIGNSVTSIGRGAFGGCYSLASIIIPNSVTSIGGNAFSGCTCLTTVHINNLESWCKIKFASSYSNPTYYAHKLYIDNEELKEVVIPSTIDTINAYAFFNCFSLDSVTIPNSVTNIGDGAFYCCSSLDSITIPNSVTNIGNSAFYGCSRLTSVTFGNSVINIGNSAFYGCTRLTSIIIPISMTSIGEGAFDYCFDLISITNLATIPQTISSDCFSNYSATLHVYEGLKSVYQNATNWSKFTIVDDVPTVKATSIKLSSPVYYCNLMDVLLPKAIVSEDATIKSVTWTSSNPSVLAILDANTGETIGMSKGDVTITATTIDGSALSASATVHVCDYTPVTSISIDPHASKVVVNEPMKLTATVLPTSATQKAVTWTSLNPEVATVNELGEITTVSLGNAVIVAGSSDGTLLTDSCRIRVVNSNIVIVNSDDVTSRINIESEEEFALSDNIKSLSITDTITSVNLTYTRNFSDAMVNNWQAWYMPCDFDYDDLNEYFDVAEIAGVLFDKDGNNYVAFRKMTEGTVKAHTPYVVRAKEVGDVVITATTTLQPTSGAKSFSMQSAYNNFTFGGVYENSYLSAEQPTYALAKNGNFAMMGETVYLRPFRIYMRITDREDNPYAAVTAPQEVKVLVLGEDDATGLTDLSNSSNLSNFSQPIFNLAGQKLQKLQKGINIVNGRKVLY